MYDTTPLEKKAFLKAAQTSQSIIRSTPLIECRVPYKNEIAHWEFDNWDISLSTTEGLYKEPRKGTMIDLIEFISNKTGFDKYLLHEILEQYRRWK
ncbi:hypothetical protein [Lentibacillus sediminis]|uniref:hypothetical protein n=1 Tax=Lentibacillus sediminis TaxID=1940529 RepID=UPI001EFD25E1|nr:hypothetical protein [Lentibacillus sediminis]